MSESLLGQGAENQSGATPSPADPQYVYAYVGFGTPISASACGSATTWNGTQRRGFTWASGEMRCGSYNHYYTPNSTSFDCINNDGTTITAFGWRGARSRHTGGVNLLLGDGSVQFINNSVSLTVWRRRRGPAANQTSRPSATTEATPAMAISPSLDEMPVRMPAWPLGPRRASRRLAMVATLPGRTQGLGLITEPLLSSS